MSKEQNIDDMLKMLKASVNTERQTANEYVEENNDISNEILQQTLKNKYMENGATDENAVAVSENEYVIDSDFLSSVSADGTEDYFDNDKPEGGEAPVARADIDEIELPVHRGDGEYSENIVENGVYAAEPDEEGDVLNAEEFSEEGADEPIECDEAEKELFADSADEPAEPDEVEEELDGKITDEPTEDGEDDLPEDNVDELIAALKPSETADTAEYEETDEAEEYDGDFAQLSPQELRYAEISIDADSGEVTFGNGGADEAEDAEDAVARTEPYETFLASMRKNGMDFVSENVAEGNGQQPESPDGGDEAVAEESAPPEDDVDISTVNLMLQFCEKDEIEETVGNQKVDDFLRFEASSVEKKENSKIADSKEYVDFSQNEAIFSAYKKKKSSALLALVACSVLAALAFIYELLPLVGAGTSGIFDYVGYPYVYALIGLQFLTVAVVICRKPLWYGIKRAFSLTPNTYSIAALMLSCTAVYGIITVIILAFTGDELPSLYNTVAIFVCVICTLADYLDVCSEMKAFGVYSSDAKKYTLIREGEESALGSKMYGGGLEKNKTVYSVHSVDFANGFFRSVEKTPDNNKILTVLTIPVVIAAVIAAIVAVVMGADAYASSAAFVICVYAVLPTALILFDILPYAVASSRLARRMSAFAGRGVLEDYEKCDVMVFNDLHIFKRCKTEDIGIAMYDTGVGYLTLGCLNALYSEIGGPLSGMKINLPDVFKFHSVKLKRVARNGIEAIIENKHTLIVGEAEYMQRYGITFPQNGQESDRLTLCVSLNGKATAKLSVKYSAEPIFEMLVERLYAEGITCAIQTYDPLINSTVLANARKLGSAPISVIHKSADDFNTVKEKRFRSEADGMIACSSRLKMAETEVWLKRLVKVKKLCERIAMGFSCFGALALTALVSFGAAGYVNQVHVMLYLLAEIAALSVAVSVLLPKKRYFTVDAVYKELEKQYRKNSKED